MSSSRTVHEDADCCGGEKKELVPPSAVTTAPMSMAPQQVQPDCGAVTVNAILPPEAAYVFEGVPIFRRFEGGAKAFRITAECDLCQQPACDGNELFQPCHCPGPRLFHRGCFRRWRCGWITAQNYFKCPSCRTNYRLERVKPADRIESASAARIARHFRVRMARFYASILTALFVLVGGIAEFAYLCDSSDKNVPVGVKYMLTGAFSGLPPDNATAVWRAQFKQPDVPVWPYYTMLGALCASIIILGVFAAMGCTFDEEDRPRRSCTSQCGCGDTCYCGDSTCRCDVCYCGSPDCNSNGNNCDCKGGGGDDCGQVLLLLVVVIIAVIIVSALVVVVAAAINKVGLYHDRMTDMMRCQAEELESETIVMGINETLRPIDAV